MRSASHAVTDRNGLLEMQASIEQVHVSEPIGTYIVDIVSSTRTSQRVQVGASPRGSLAILKLSRAKAALEGRDFVTPEDVKAVAVPALSHRLISETGALGAESASGRCRARVARNGSGAGCRGFAHAHGMTRSPSPKVGAYAGLAALGLLAAVALRLPELVLLAAPFAVVATAQRVSGAHTTHRGRGRARPRARPRRRIARRLDPVRAGEAVERLDVLLELPAGLELEDGDNPSTLRLVEGGERLLSLRLRCARWGAFRVGRIHLRAHDHFGMFRHEVTIDARQPLKVYPTEEAVRTLLRPSETQVFSGNHVARQKAEGIEFADIRQFVAGDRVRHVNWRATARRGELWVNEHHAERNADVVIFLDVFAEARRGERSTLDPALRAAASLAARYLRQRDRVGFVSYGGMLNWLLPATGARQLYRIVDAMLDTQIILSYAWQDLVVVPRAHPSPRQALVLALTPLLDDRAATALLDLRARGFDLIVIEISPLALVVPKQGEIRTSRTGCGGCAVMRSAVASSERVFPWRSGTTTRHSRLPWRRWKHFAGRQEPRACRHRAGSPCAPRCRRRVLG